jgi:flagellar protein FlaJ
MNLDKLDRISYRIFGKWVESKSGNYLELQRKLLQARIGVPFEVYVSRASLISVLLSFPAGIYVYFLFSNLLQILGNVSFLLIPLLSVVAGFIVFNIIFSYPYIKANMRGRDIDIILPHTVALMHALSRGSSDIAGFFKIIAKNKKVYGEMSDEVKSTLVDTKILNHDINTALKNSASNTSSESYKNFLESLSTVITSGGNLVAFFLTKSEQYRQKAESANKAFMDSLAVLAEMYVTGLAVGPLFIIVLLVVLGLIGGAKYYIFLLIIVYLLVPFGAIFFIFLLSSTFEGSTSRFVKIEKISGTRLEDPSIQKGMLRMKIYEFIKHPLKNLVENPENVLYVSVPAGLLFFLLNTYIYYGLDFNELVYKIDNYIVFSVIIVLLPYTLFVEAHFRRINQISANFPEFLNRLVSLHESGLTLSASLKKLRASNLGILNEEINKLNAGIELNESLIEAFHEFGKRINTVAVHRVVVLIENAIRITGNVKDTLLIAANDARTARSLEEERVRSIKLYVMILYIAFFVFLYVIWSLITGFFPQLPDAPSDAVNQLMGDSVALSGFDKPLYIRLFFHAALIEGFFSGLVAGQIGEGDVRLGLKHSIVMITVAYIIFAFMI